MAKLPSAKPTPKIKIDVNKPPLKFECFEDIPNTDNIGTGCKIDDTPLDGNRKSVLVGINYVDMQGELRGCINDVHRMRGFIALNGFPEGHEQYILTDQDEKEFKDLPNVQHASPTKENILTALYWLTKGAAPGDSLFFHYSGHGVRVPDKSGDEADGKDESIVPLDYRTRGVIIDDLLYTILVSDLPKGCRLTAVMDCCHSGSGLDLPFTFEAKSDTTCETVKQGGKNFSKNENMATRAVRIQTNKVRFLQKAVSMGIQVEASTAHGMSIQPRGMALKSMKEQEAVQVVKPSRIKLWKTIADIIDEAEDKEEAEILQRVMGPIVRSRDITLEEPHDDKMSRGCVVLFSGCQDVQTAGDVSSTKMFDLPDTLGPDGAGGACTAAFIQTLSANPHLSYIDTLIGMRKDLEEKKFKQIPQLSSTMAFDLNSTFDMEK